MKVDKLTLNHIFDRTERLEAPIFQRPYVWKQEENWEPLWESIKNICDRRFENKQTRPHFFGTIVLDQVGTPTGKLPARQIIDGQQRLTTFQLFLAAVRDLCKERSETKYAETFEKLTINDFPLKESDDEDFKVWPTNSDQNIFRRIMKAGSPIAVRKISDEDEFLIAQAYLYFSDEIGQWLGASGTEEFKTKLGIIYQIVRTDLLIVVIDLEEGDDAQEIFETLNALGTPLLPADLVKNYLFHLAEFKKLNTEELYKKYWSVFDQETKYWRHEIRQGRLKKPVLDHFLNHYLTLMLADEVPSTQLFTNYKRYVQESNMDVSVQMAQFLDYAMVYKSFDEFSEESREELFFYRLDQLDTTTVYPLLLELVKIYYGKENKKTLVDILLDIESFLVRRLICELTPKNFNKLFIGLVKELKNTNDFSHSKIRNHLLSQTSDISRWPNDEELYKSWMNNEFYRRQKRSRASMILKALNSALHTGKTELLKLDDKLTIEHLLPQDWGKYWPLDTKEGGAGYKEKAEIRNSVLHKIGNLTLLTKELNPSVSNGPWDKKRKEILKHSALNLNRSLPDKWNERAIEDRGKELFKTVVKIWPYPTK